MEKIKVIRLLGGGDRYKVSTPTRFWSRVLATVEELPKYLAGGWQPSDNNRYDYQFGERIKEVEIIPITDPSILQSFAKRIVALEETNKDLAFQKDGVQEMLNGLVQDIPKDQMKALRSDWKITYNDGVKV